MYGLVNSSLQSFVVQEHGEAAWQRVKSRAGVSESEFVTMRTYPDEISYALVAAAHTELDVPVDTFLHELGEHWVIYATTKGYGAMLERAGNSFVEVLKNLDAMHARIALTFPELRPPSFRVRNVTQDSLELHYFSHRPGLLPFVRGLLVGLGRRFENTIEATVTQSREQGHDHDVLLIRIGGGRE